MHSVDLHPSQVLPAFKRAMVSLAACLLILTVFSCAGSRPISDNAHDPPPQADWQTYARLHKTLEQTGKTIDYDTLVQVYQALISTPGPIARIDELISALSQKRNEDPRVDQMVLILAAKAIGSSKYPIAHVDQLFASILNQGDDRINSWVLSFVAEAIGDYPEEIPEGDRLVDLVEQRLKHVSAATGASQEYFGFHFLPPPKSSAVRAYMASLHERRVREWERRYYYALIQVGISEKDIAAQLKRLQMHTLPGAGEHNDSAMQYLYTHWDQIR